MRNHLAPVSRARVSRVVLMCSLLFAVGGVARPVRADIIYFPFFDCLIRAGQTRLNCKASDDYVERLLCEMEYLADLAGCVSGID